jgi:hypothetical protein
VPQAIWVLARSPALRARAPERAPDRRAAQRDDLRLSTEHALAGLHIAKHFDGNPAAMRPSYLDDERACKRKRDLPPIVQTVVESSVLFATTIGGCASAAKRARKTSLRKPRRTLRA